jgi:hypothetical protein
VPQDVANVGRLGVVAGLAVARIADAV